MSGQIFPWVQMNFLFMAWRMLRQYPSRTFLILPKPVLTALLSLMTQGGSVEGLPFITLAPGWGWAWILYPVLCSSQTEPLPQGHSPSLVLCSLHSCELSPCARHPVLLQGSPRRARRTLTRGSSHKYHKGTQTTFQVFTLMLSIIHFIFLQNILV